jgi:tetratricopeptide (TPR) repeat protein
MADELTEAQNLYEKGEYQSAIKLFEEITQDEPSNALAYQGLAQCFFKLKQFNASLDACLKAISLDPILYQSHRLAGILYYMQKQFDLSESEYREAISSAPTEWAAYMNLGTFLLNQNRLEESENELKHAKEIRSDRWETYHALGIIYWQKKRYRDALNEMKRSFSLRPSPKVAFEVLILYIAQNLIFFSLSSSFIYILAILLPSVYAIPVFIIMLLFPTWSCIILFKGKQLARAILMMIFVVLLIVFFVFVHLHH